MTNHAPLDGGHLLAVNSGLSGTPTNAHGFWVANQWHLTDYISVGDGCYKIWHAYLVPGHLDKATLAFFTGQFVGWYVCIPECKIDSFHEIPKPSWWDEALAMQQQEWGGK